MTIDTWNLIEKLCGQKPSPAEYVKAETLVFPEGGIGQSQLNEILLAGQLDRVDEGFFKYVFSTHSIGDKEQFIECINAYRIKAIIKYGNFKYAFKFLRDKPIEFIQNEFAEIEMVNRNHYQTRHKPLMRLRTISPKDTYYLGYIVDEELKRLKRKKNLANKKIADFQKKIDQIRKDGQYNQAVYLDYDHMDVYVATSMRERIDYWNVSKFTKNVFDSDILKILKLRYFDPTQAYCPNRIDKGIVEGLMLKRANCTIYMAGETETLGKDSELATTLAQGKPVIAYVPKLTDYTRFRNEYVAPLLEELYPEENPVAVALDFLKLYYPQGPWVSKKVRSWIEGPRDEYLENIIELVFKKAIETYDLRAKTLKDYHPLGVQVNLETGVANGVLVARTVEECAELVEGVLLNTLEFKIKDVKGTEVLYEQKTGSIFRVVTRDEHLTNSFWNFYLKV